MLAICRVCFRPHSIYSNQFLVDLNVLNLNLTSGDQSFELFDRKINESDSSTLLLQSIIGILILIAIFEKNS